MSKIYRFRGLVIVFILVLLYWTNVGLYFGTPVLAIDRRGIVKERCAMRDTAEGIRRKFNSEYSSIYNELVELTKNIAENERKLCSLLADNSLIVLSNSIKDQLKTVQNIEPANLLRALGKSGKTGFSSRNELRKFLDKEFNTNGDNKVQGILNSDFLCSVNRFLSCKEGLNTKLGTIKKEMQSIDGVFQGLKLRSGQLEQSEGLKKLKELVQSEQSDEGSTKETREPYSNNNFASSMYRECSLECDNIKKKSKL